MVESLYVHPSCVKNTHRKEFAIQTLALNLLSKGPEGESLPTVFRELGMYGANIRKGQLTLVAAGSGVGKSSLITFVAMNMRDRELDPIPTLYFSADSDVTTFGIRAGTMAVGNLFTSDVEKLLLSKDPEILSTIQDATSHIWISFDSSPSCVDVEAEIEAYALVNGSYPELIIVDNLMDVRTGMDDRAGQDAVLDYLKQSARRTQAAVVVLCHVVAAGKSKDEHGKVIDVDYASGKHPIPLSGIMNKLDKRPRLILTLYEVDENVLGICIVKNNNGRRDADGGLQVHVPWIKERMWIGKK